MNLRRWLTPGIGIKRWLLVVFGGLLLLAVAGAHFIRQVTRDVQPGSTAGTVVDLITLQFLPYALRGFLVGLVGISLVAFGSIRVARALVGRSGRQTATSRSSRSSTRSDSSPAAPGSSRSAAEPGCRRCCAASRSTRAT